VAGLTHSTAGQHAYGCSVPRLTRFAGSACMGPGHNHSLMIISWAMIIRYYNGGAGDFPEKVFNRQFLM